MLINLDFKLEHFWDWFYVEKLIFFRMLQVQIDLYMVQIDWLSVKLSFGQKGAYQSIGPA